MLDLLVEGLGRSDRYILGGVHVDEQSGSPIVLLVRVLANRRAHRVKTVERATGFERPCTLLVKCEGILTVMAMLKHCLSRSSECIIKEAES